MSAEEIAQALGGRKVGGTCMACCPEHDDSAPSLFIRERPARCWCMLGQCRGGVVPTAQRDSLPMIGEGIEPCRSAMQVTGRPAWAALPASDLRSLDLPPDVRDVIELADGDEPGEAAAGDCAQRWKYEGRRSRIASLPTGMDFNNMVMAFRADIAHANTGPAKDLASASTMAAPQIDQAMRGDLPWL